MTEVEAFLGIDAEGGRLLLVKRTKAVVAAADRPKCGELTRKEEEACGFANLVDDVTRVPHGKSVAGPMGRVNEEPFFISPSLRFWCFPQTLIAYYCLAIDLLEDTDYWARPKMRQLKQLGRPSASVASPRRECFIPGRECFIPEARAIHLPGRERFISKTRGFSADGVVP
jgi:hypothetical protein